MPASLPSSGLLLLRHAESTWNAAGRWQGQSDPPLSGPGAERARATASLLLPYEFGAVYCSDLSRARHTADLIAAVIGSGPPIPDRRLRERDIGAWAGLTDRQIAEGWQGQPEQWRADEDAAPPGGGEDAAAVADRARECLAEIHDRHSDCRVLLVTHGGLIRTLDRAGGGSHDPVPNLGGLWFEAIAGELRAGGNFDAGNDADATAVY